MVYMSEIALFGGLWGLSGLWAIGVPEKTLVRNAKIGYDKGK